MRPGRVALNAIVPWGIVARSTLQDALHLNAERALELQ